MSAAVSSARVAIVPMTEAELEEVAALEESSFSSTSTREERMARLREELGRPWSHTWVARDCGRIVAFLLFWKVADEIHVLSVATARAERQAGHASALLRALIDEARTGGVRHVLLEVRRSNAPAIALYRKHDFAATGVRRAYYDDDEDAVEMALSLDPATGALVPRGDEVALD
jgi:ribosomal-protein-alanine N-acetyltransferase